MNALDELIKISEKISEDWLNNEAINDKKGWYISESERNEERYEPMMELIKISEKISEDWLNNEVINDKKGWYTSESEKQKETGDKKMKNEKYIIAGINNTGGKFEDKITKKMYKNTLNSLLNLENNTLGEILGKKNIGLDGLKKYKINNKVKDKSNYSEKLLRDLNERRYKEILEGKEDNIRISYSINDSFAKGAYSDIEAMIGEEINKYGCNNISNLKKLENKISNTEFGIDNYISNVMSVQKGLNKFSVKGNSESITYNAVIDGDKEISIKYEKNKYTEIMIKGSNGGDLTYKIGADNKARITKNTAKGLNENDAMKILDSYKPFLLQEIVEKEKIMKKEKKDYDSILKANFNNGIKNEVLIISSLYEEDMLRKSELKRGCFVLPTLEEERERSIIYQK
jgi:hypothetical protein